MEHHKFIWNCENMKVYIELLLEYVNLEKEDKVKAKMRKHLNQLKAGYRPVELLSYF